MVPSLMRSTFVRLQMKQKSHFFVWCEYGTLAQHNVNRRAFMHVEKWNITKLLLSIVYCRCKTITGQKHYVNSAINIVGCWPGVQLCIRCGPLVKLYAWQSGHCLNGLRLKFRVAKNTQCSHFHRITSATAVAKYSTLCAWLSKSCSCCCWYFNCNVVLVVGRT